MNLEECEKVCLRNCNCIAYANLGIRSGGSGCLIWLDDLIDMMTYAEDGEDINVRMAASELRNVEDGKEIAVKRNSGKSIQGLDEFRNEVQCIAKLQHRNIVMFIGCCIDKEERILIYVYVPNKSLDSFIFDEGKKKSLDRSTRYSVIIGITTGLLYLHQDSRLRIIHRDLKASNVLLDKEMNPRISDFGLARSMEGSYTSANTKRVMGTYGYMAPEYAIDRIYSTKSDVFSFGVLVLEIVSGKKNRGFKDADNDLNLLGHRLYNNRKHVKLIDNIVNRFFARLSEGNWNLLCIRHESEKTAWPIVVRHAYVKMAWPSVRPKWN
nr:G-type lectin S-receptor-like serine/threonine-protein kinase At4g27290 isoform X2 [Tanacetum cinerariifolium]